MNLKMRKRTKIGMVLLTALFISAPQVRAQVTIGASIDPNEGAFLDLKTSNDKVNATRGFGLPRVQLTEPDKLYPMLEDPNTPGVPIAGYETPEEITAMHEKHIGLTVFNVALSGEMPAGVYIWNGSMWSMLAFVQSESESEAVSVTFSNGKDTPGSVMDLISAAKGAGLSFIDVELPPLEGENIERVSFSDKSKDFGDKGGLVLDKDKTPSFVTLNGHGRVIDLAGEADSKPLITVGAGMTLVLKNITFKGLTDGDTAGEQDNNAPVIKVEYGGTLVMESNSKVIGNTAKSNNGGGVYLNGGKLVMNFGSSISGNTAEQGGGVYLEGNAILDMEGGAISDNAATVRGGGVYAYNGANVTFSSRGGAINNNTSGMEGGGIYLQSGLLTITGSSTITGNTANQKGGGMLADQGCIIIMEGGAINNNTAGEGGGGLYLKDSQFDMRRGSISGNMAQNKGGGICMDEGSGRFVLNDGSISGNKVTDPNGFGGGVYINHHEQGNRGSFTMIGGNISGNSIAPDSQTLGTGKGIGVYVNMFGRFTKQGGTIHGLAEANNNQWLSRGDQNYYAWQMDTAPGEAHFVNCDNNCNFCNDGVPGSGRGYAVYWKVEQRGDIAGLWLNKTVDAATTFDTRIRRDDDDDEEGVSRLVEFVKDDNRLWTWAATCGGVIFDERDFNVYSTGYFYVDIDDDNREGGEWMTENLRYTNEIDHDPEGNADERRYVYPGPDGLYDENNKREDLGVLYNWQAAVDDVCPEGWRLPYPDEWDALVSWISDDKDGKYSTTTATGSPGTKMKSTTEVNGTTNGTSKPADKGGFDALLAGYVDDGTRKAFGSETYFWMSEGNGDDADRLKLKGNDAGVDISTDHKARFYSVRCRQD
ncbi:MAG: hypothetical protein LBH12_00610 [Dysgonamonadaceae bacterium]|nr:hypothetical protein [Dysgonamonadaceae bacterium]